MPPLPGWRSTAMRGHRYEYPNRSTRRRCSSVRGPDGKVRVDVRLEGDTVWLTQRQMSEIFGTTPENVLMHLKNVFGDGELEEAATAKDFLVVQTEGNRQVRRNLKHYNLDAIISVGYRVKSSQGTPAGILCAERSDPNYRDVVPNTIISAELRVRDAEHQVKKAA